MKRHLDARAHGFAAAVGVFLPLLLHVGEEGDVLLALREVHNVLVVLLQRRQLQTVLLALRVRKVMGPS
eukprot:4480748-Pyramimonas_sp.AAC.1